MSPELINILKNMDKIIQLNLEKINVFSLGIILI